MKSDRRPSKGRVAAYRARLREAGLVKLEVWAFPQDHARIRAFVAEITQLPAEPVDPDPLKATEATE